MYIILLYMCGGWPKSQQFSWWVEYSLPRAAVVVCSWDWSRWTRLWRPAWSAELPPRSPSLPHSQTPRTCHPYNVKYTCHAVTPTSHTDVCRVYYHPLAHKLTILVTPTMSNTYAMLSPLQVTQMCAVFIITPSLMNSPYLSPLQHQIHMPCCHPYKSHWCLSCLSSPLTNELPILVTPTHTHTHIQTTVLWLFGFCLGQPG